MIATPIKTIFGEMGKKPVGLLKSIPTGIVLENPQIPLFKISTT